ncbi:hypothetical protein J3458_012936 [Metarhizium acridum]|uniref:uncharacterized protein n=1 Tax=Metarhizium acridum TaxID=92637 RepID=UPI001C6C06AE|nr:hypothetical protein J3458_012936 [Metarhizium acridum]
MASRKDACLIQIHHSPNLETDVDIIAIHGLDTKAPDKWTWKDRHHPKNNVNWLEKEDMLMLPHEVGNAQIFVCNWEAGMFQKSTNLKESTQSFLRIMRPQLKQEERGAVGKPSCLLRRALGHYFNESPRDRQHMPGKDTDKSDTRNRISCNDMQRDFLLERT